ncbi:leucyl aminopeptidase [Rhodoligotrophos defluvii]|uniref:leucyl aminopeptidase n=1 Tax=Rhodoligotrophos defluvii TaxID=2561934 RepID=UPI0010C98F81|nr:leucyl aminopeptidase [Rhodoligotrophos defluvii]
MKIKFAKPQRPKTGTLVILAGEGAGLSGFGASLDEASGGAIARAMKASGFTGKREKLLDILAPAGLELDRVLVAGLGKLAELKSRDLELVGGAIAGAVSSGKSKDVAVVVELGEGAKVATADAAAAIAAGVKLRDYTFDKYKTKKKDDENGNKKPLRNLTIMSADADAAKAAAAPLLAVAEGVHLARDLVNEPPNVLYPASYAKRAEELTRLGVKVEVLGEKEMTALGMGALLAVGQGSSRESRLVVMTWQGGRKDAPPIAIIGKGVVFDTGGISIKPGAGMQDMKGDMAGSACVVGLMHALAARKARANVVGVIGLVENMPDGSAYRPGDILTSMSGQTIEVQNTDAEGRLVLADALWYTQERFKPRFMIDLATLTGAILIALGKEHAGLFSNNDELAAHITAAGVETGEKVWRLPLGPEYDKLIDSDVADMKNVGGRNAGSITAAQFLQRFVNGVPWAHLDIAGTGMDANKTALSQHFGSGWGVQLLNRLIADHYET